MLDSRANSRGWEAAGQGERPQSVVPRPAAAAASKSLPLPQSVPSPARKLEAGKGLARLAQAEQTLGRGSAVSRLGAELELRR